MSDRFRIDIFVEEEGKSLNEAWEALNDETKQHLNKTVELLKLMLGNGECNYHPNALKSIVISYEKSTDITSTSVNVCCFWFASIVQEFLDKHFPAPINVGFLKPNDQRSQN